jgi:CRISPR/Cas system endoribonuclease Cas6 (RAMP superfamily)
MTIPEYDEECDCDDCKEDRKQRISSGGTMTLSPYQCETCKDEDCHYHPRYEDEDMDLYERLRYNFVHLFTKIKGCASHSNFTSAERVLDEVLEIINRADVTYCWNKDLKRMKELRQRKERERG